MMRASFNSKSISKTILLLALLASLFSFAKFQHCREFGWGSPGNYVHACYSDITSLYGARGLNTDSWPYTSANNSVEYPVLTGVVMWATALLVDDKNGFLQYFDLNIFFIILLFILSAILLWKYNPEFAYLFPIAPAVIASLFINWDIWALVTALGALLFFIRGSPRISALLLGLSIATKFFPILFLLPVFLIYWKNRKMKKFAEYFLITSAIWLVINLPVVITNYAGWSRFFTLNSHRQADLGSLWLALQTFHIPIWNINYAGILFGVILLASLIVLFAKVGESQSDKKNIALFSFLTLAGIMTINKVYSPQYVLWLVPLAVMAITSKKERSAFWIWQGGELIYHVAVWQYLALQAGGKFGIGASVYALLIILRIATLGWFSFVLVRSALTSRSTGLFHPEAPYLIFSQSSKAVTLTPLLRS